MIDVVTRDPRRIIEDLHARYVRCIDDDRLEAWPDLFTDPCRYQITTRENVTRHLPLGLIECTTSGMLRDRIEALRRVNVYEPHTYSHHISSLEITPHVPTTSSCARCPRATRRSFPPVSTPTSSRSTALRRASANAS
jgi:hypothetical protein